MLYLRFLLVLSICISFTCNTYAIGATDSKPELVKKWPKADAIISRYQTIIEFYFDEETHQPMVKQSDEVDIIPITDITLTRYCFYDDESFVYKPLVYKDGVSKRKYNTLSGDWESEDVFHSDLKFSQYKISVETDAVFYRFKSDKHIKDLHYFSKSFFNDPAYPIAQRTFEIRVPKWIDLDIREFNFNYFKVVSTSESQSDLKVYKYTVWDLPSTKNDDYFLSAEHSFPHLLFQVKSYTDASKAKIPIFADLNGYYGWIQALYKELKTNKELLQPLVNDIVKPCANRTDSIRALYYWVQDNIRYIAFENGLAGLIPEQADKVFTNKYGDCKGMANLLKAMLNLAGFDARLVWLGTNHLVYDYSLPCLAVGNHMICYLNDNNNHYYLDATQKMQPLGFNSDGIQGKQVMIEDGNRYLIQSIPFAEATANAIITTANLTLNNSDLTGSVDVCYKGNKKLSVINHINQLKTTDRDKFILNDLLYSRRYTIDSLKYTSPDQRETDFVLHFKTEAKNQVVSTGNDFYLNLDLMSSTDWSAIDTTNIYHLNMGMKSYSEVITMVSLPANMQVVTIPTDEKFQAGSFRFEITYKKIGSSIIYKRTMTVDKAIIAKPEFKSFTEFRKKYQKSRTRSIQLQKV